jgi:hypothetical protein
LGGHARRVTLDLDPTDDSTHGAQQLSFFNSRYDNACYLPMMGFVTFNDEADQYLCAAVLRPGNVTAAAGAVGILRRLMALIRSSFVSVVFWPPCLAGFEDSSSTCGGHMATEGLGWVRVLRLLKALLAGGGSGRRKKSGGSWKRRFRRPCRWHRLLGNMA